MRRTLTLLALACLGTVARAVDGVGARRLFSAAGKHLVVEALRDDILHFELAAVGAGDASHPIYTTPMVAKTDYPGPTGFKSDDHHVETPALLATISETLCVTVHDKLRNVDLQTVCPLSLDQAWKGLTVQSPATRNVYGLGQYFAAEDTDGDWLGRLWDPLTDGFGARLRGFAGGANDYSMFPIMYALGDGTQGYAFFLDQIYKQQWDFRQSPWTINTWGDQIRWYVMAGPDLPSLRRAYMELTGRPPVPPRRSFGLWVSEFGFLNWGEVHTALSSLRQSHFPVEGFAMDLEWFGGTFGDPDRSKMGSLTWDEQNFPDPRGEIARLAADGVNLMPIEEPYIAKILPEYAALEQHAALALDCAACGPTYLDYNPWWGRGGMVDYTGLAAGDFWHDYRRQDLVSMGINDHWADLGEPEQYNANAWYQGFPDLSLHAHADIHNIYGFRWMESIYRGYQRHANPKRPYLLSRTGTSGIQRFGVGMWSGDIGTNWGNLRAQMNVQMHMSLSGIDFYGSDAGGFQRAKTSGDQAVEGGPELLYTQWFAASSLLDVPVRPHAWNLDKQRPTAPSERGDKASNLDNLRLRYRLAPYYYSQAFRAHLEGEPLIPPLVYHFQSDPNVRRIGSEKMIGPSLLAQVVADPNAVTHSVYLPQGRWSDVRTGTWVTSGGQTVNDWPLYAAHTFQDPLFARGGAILPLAEVDDATMNIRGKRSDGQLATALTVRVYADKSASSFDLYEDDGETYGYDSGKVAITHLTQQLQGAVEAVDIGSVQGSYSGMPETRLVTIEVVAEDQEATAATLDGVAVPFKSIGHGITQVEAGDRRLGATTHLSLTLKTVAPVAPSAVVTCRNGATTAGTSVYAVGSIPALGAWQPAHAIKLTPAAYPIWSAKLEGLPPGTAIEWKCVRQREDGTGTPEWQPGGNNQLTTGTSGYAGASTGAF